jgi:1,5-anhydro-D-fructose reductase (1,5-anhydro-D-mannitol-forming)
MTAAQPIRIGIMSFAHPHAGSYIAELQRRDGVELLAADPEGAQAVGDALRGEDYAASVGVPYVASYDELLRWKPDAVIVCSENTRHRAAVELAAAAGAHVLCEKPLATTVADAEAMVAACDRAGVRLMTAFPMRFTPMFASMRSAIEAGEIGTVLGATGTNNGKLPLGGGSWFTDPELAGGGALVDLTVHIADLVDALLQPAEVTSVYAATNRILHGEVPGIVSETGGLVTLTYSNGVTVSIDCSWSHPESAPNWGGLTLEVLGTDGAIEIDPFALRVGGFEESRGQDFWLGYGPNNSRPLLDEFLSALRDGRQPEPSGLAGLRTARVVEAAQAAAATGEVVHLAPVADPAGAGGDPRMY